MKRIVLGVSAVAIAFALSVSFAAAANYSIMPSLTLGSTGPEVVELQQMLVAKGYLVMPAGVNYGYFGGLTQAAVVKLQIANGIVPAAGYYGPLTAAKVNSWEMGGGSPSTPSTPGNDLGGGEASLEDFDLSSGNDSDVEEGASGEVAEIEFDVEDADVEVNRIDLSLVGDSGNDETDPWDTFESLRLLVDGDEIAEVDLSDEDEYLDEDTGTVRLSNLDYVVNEGDTATIVVEVTAQNSVDGAEDDLADWTINVEDDGIRATDGEGIEQYIGTDSDTVDFSISVEGEGEELNVSSSDEDPDAETFKVEDDSRSDWYSIFAFDIEAEESDVDLDSAIVRVTTSATTSDMVADYILEIDGEEFDDWDYVGTPAAGSSTVDVEFDIDGDFTVDADSEVTAVLKAEFKAVAAQGGYSSSTTNTVLAQVVDGAIEGEGSDDLVSDGTATGETHTLSLQGLEVDLVSKETDTSGENDTVGEFTFEVDITAFEEDAFVELAATRGTTESNTGFNVVILDGENNTVSTGTTTFSLTADKDEDGATNRVEIGQGDTVRFTVEVFFDAATTGSYKAYLYSVNFNDTDADADSQKVLSPESEFRSGAEALNAS